MPRQERYAQGSVFARPGYFDDIGNVSLLGAEEEREVVHRVVCGDVAAREQLIAANLRLVIHIAKRFAQYVSAAEYSDLIQEGNIGLIEAVDNVDEERSNKFSTYAGFHIRKAIFVMLAESGKLIHVPQKISSAIRAIAKTEYALSQQLGRKPGRDEIAKKMGIPLEDLYHLEQTSRVEMSLDSTPFEPEDGSVQLPSDLIADTSVDSIEDQLVERSSREIIRKAIASLRPRDARIATQRFGLGDEDVMSLGEIGKLEGGVTRERIRMIEVRILRHLRFHPEVRKLRDLYK
jgi:RNA polymerase primary sigma factor